MDHFDLRLEQRLSVGFDSGRGNAVGIQPSMVLDDYRSGANLYSKLARYFDAASEEGWLQARTVVVLPEHVGTWLVAAEEHDVVYEAETVTRAMRALLIRRPGAFLRSLQVAIGKATDIARFSLFRIKAPTMARIYQEVFARLARTYHVTIVTGSIILPAPAIENGRLALGSHPLYNVSLVFRPDGTAYDDLVRKVFPVTDELSFVRGGTPSILPTFDTPAGRLGVLVCADSWQPACYHALRSQKPDLIVVPSFLGPDGVWTRPWRGYDGAPPPDDVDPFDIGRITEEEAWIKYALPGRLRDAGATLGINVFLRGALWDLGADGRTLVVHGGDVTQVETVQGAAIVNLWVN